MNDNGSCFREVDWSRIIRSTRSYLYKTFCYPCSTTFTFVRVFYFAFYGGLGCILPFLSLYFKQNGLTPMQIGWVSGIKPIMTLIGAPLFGAIGDGYQISRWLLLGSLGSWVIVYASLIFIPSPKEQYRCAVWDKPDFTDSALLSNTYVNLTKDNLSSLDIHTNQSLQGRGPGDDELSQNITDLSSFAISSNLSSSSVNSASSFSSSTYQSSSPSHPYWILYNSNTSQIQLVRDKISGSTQDEMEQYNETIHQKVIVDADESLWWLYHQADRKKVFIMVLMITVVGELFTSPASALADAGTSQTLGIANMEYFGVQRAWGPVGFAVRYVCY